MAGRVLAPALALALTLPGCAGLRRGGEDLAAVATTPIHAVTTPIAHFAADWEEDRARALGQGLLTIPLYCAADLFWSVVAAGDAALTPFYMAFDVEPFGHFEWKRNLPVLRRKTVRDTGTVAAGVLAVFAECVDVFCIQCCGAYLTRR